jgi:RNA polymerase sigma factor (sigma-70 family)
MIREARLMPREDQELTFESFFEQEYGRLFRAMWLTTGSRWEGEDLAQEAMARAYERWDRVVETRSPAAYVYVIALNLHRRRLRRALLALRSFGGNPFPADAIKDAEMRNDVLGAIGRLPRQQREALVLVEWVGLTPDEAGEILGIAGVSVRGRLHRARTTLKSELGGIDE